ncbi:MAG: group I truncated hemoglobin [Polyangiaceae bacterium]
MSLYDDMGGEAAVRAVLKTLYDRLFDDRMVGFLFAGKDKEKLITQQLWFTARFLGGPSRYEGKSIPDAHAALPLLPGHFDRRHHLLEQALEQHRVPAHVAEEWLRVDSSLKSAVLKTGEEARERARRP